MGAGAARRCTTVQNRAGILSLTGPGTSRRSRQMPQGRSPFARAPPLRDANVPEPIPRSSPGPTASLDPFRFPGSSGQLDCWGRKDNPGGRHRPLRMFGDRSPRPDAGSLGYCRLVGTDSLAAGADPAVGTALRLIKACPSRFLAAKRKAQAVSACARKTHYCKSSLYADAAFTCVSAVATSFTSGTTGIS